MTFTVDVEAVNKMAGRFEAEADEIETARAAVPDVPAGGMSTFVNSIVNDLLVDAKRDGANFDSTASSMRFSATLSQLTDQGAYQGFRGLLPPNGLLPPGVPPGPLLPSDTPGTN